MSNIAPVDPIFAPLYDYVVKLAAKAGLESSAVIWAESSGVVPSDVYVTLRIGHVVEQGLAQQRSTNDDSGDIEVITPMSFELQIEVIGGAAVALAAQMRSATYMPSLLGASGNWSVSIRMPVTNVAAMLTRTTTQPRAVFALVMQGALLMRDNMGYIENAAGNGTYSPSGDTCSFSVTTEDP